MDYDYLLSISQASLRLILLLSFDLTRDSPCAREDICTLSGNGESRVKPKYFEYHVAETRLRKGVRKL